MRSPLPSPLVTALPSPLVDPLGMGGGGLNMSCFNFTGSNYATIAALSTNLLAGGGSFTVSFWVKGTDYVAAAQSPFTLNGDSNNRLNFYYPLGATNNIFTTLRVNSQNLDNTTLGAGGVTKQWELWRATYDHTDRRARFYKNGSLVTTSAAATGAFAAVAATRFFLGHVEGGSLPFTGQQADIRIYSAVVTPNHAIPATSESNVVAWYPYPNAAGNARDMINGNHLTTTGGSMLSTSGGPGLLWVTLP